jgi:DNA N-6-adenine-methyltransferase Dam
MITRYMTLGSHQQCFGKSQEHVTPKWIIDALGPFDLDPCAADPRAWSCARVNYTEADDGLSKPWRGRCWLNPPYDRYAVGKWIRKLADHGRGVALLHARTEAGWFEPIWKGASGILFMADRIHFHKPDGTRHSANSGAPPVLVAFGADDLERSLLHGRRCREPATADS